MSTLDPSLRDEILRHLQTLILFDTRVQPRDLDEQHPVFSYLTEHLPGFEIEILCNEKGSVGLLATRGTPKLLIYGQLDTSVLTSQWTRDPFLQTVEDGRVYGLGACDSKGAIACILAAAKQTTGDIAICFKSDDESEQGAFARTLLDRDHSYEVVVVSEPTGCEAVVEHRGLVSGKVTFQGMGGHASMAHALEDSAIHEAVRWSARAIEWATERAQEDRYKNLTGIGLNLGKIEGGIKSNMIATDATVHYNFRPLPSHRSSQLTAQLSQFVEHPWRAHWEVDFQGPTLPASHLEKSGADRVDAAARAVEELGLVLGDPVDFWTEAALFSNAHVHAVVFGPGKIEQTHASDEYVEISQLMLAVEAFRMIMSSEEEREDYV